MSACIAGAYTIQTDSLKFLGRHRRNSANSLCDLHLNEHPRVPVPLPRSILKHRSRCSRTSKRTHEKRDFHDPKLSNIRMTVGVFGLKRIDDPTRQKSESFLSALTPQGGRCRGRHNQRVIISTNENFFEPLV